MILKHLRTVLPLQGHGWMGASFRALFHVVFRRQNSPMAAAIKTFVVGTLSLVIIFTLVIQADGKEAKVKVLASIFPAYDFVRVIGGERVDLRQLLPPGVEAHGFSPTPRDIIGANQADLFFYTGRVMEPRVAKMLDSIDGNVLVVDLSTGLYSESTPDHHLDPHFWLDPVSAQAMVDTITEALVQVDPEHSAGYKRRAKMYLGHLNDLDGSIRRGLLHCKQRTIIAGGHFAFGHFIKRYHLQAISAYPGFSPDGKPSPKAITTLIKTMEKTGATAVYHEELMDPKVARIIVEETGAQLLLLHGAHNVSKQEMIDGVNYISIMEGNLRRLREGLSCQ